MAHRYGSFKRIGKLHAKNLSIVMNRTLFSSVLKVNPRAARKGGHTGSRSADRSWIAGKPDVIHMSEKSLAGFFPACLIFLDDRHFEQ